MPRAWLAIVVSMLLALPAPAAGGARSVAIFDFELIDTSLDGEVNGPRADEAARLARLGEALRKQLAASGRYAVVDIAPVAAEARGSNLQACGGCDTVLARRLGAELAITGMVNKISNLILHLSVYIRDANTGRAVAAISVSFRGNTDESWSRALDWLVRNRLLEIKTE